MCGRLLRLLEDAAGGVPPAADGMVEVWPAPDGPVDAVLAFTAHHVVAAGVDPDLVAARLPDGDLGAPMSPGFLGWLGERLGSHPGSLDVVLAAPGLGGDPPLDLRPVEGPGRHPRAARARRYRRDLRVWTDPDGAGVLVLGRGLAGRRELSFEVDPARRNRGLGQLLVAAARHLTPAGEPLFAQVSPGNAASLRVVEAAGFRPIGAEVLFHRDGADPT
ncbi:MAG TPA: GNAT family N-acetyltransferase [Actinomycetota bacterium]|nr:GNAT family N-acetyltransferase [Actinomycetota bacterium]